LEFSSEMENFRDHAQNALLHVNSRAPFDHCHPIQGHAHGSCYPNTIFSAILPVTAVSCERSFSELKIIKTY
jgi:hypothetical protein